MPKSRFLLPLLVTFIAIPTAQAAPDDLCVRQAKAVPGAAVKHPQWWNPGLSESQREVRWTEATAVTGENSETPELASTRAIWDKPSHTVFFEFSLAADPSIDGDDDVVYVAVSDTTGNQPELFIQFQPLRGCTPVSNCTGNGSAIDPSSINYAAATGGGTSITWSTLSTTNPNPNFTVQHPWVEVRPVAGGSSYNWTLKFALEVPTAGGGHVRPNLRIYGNAVMNMPGPTSSTAVEFPLLCNPSSPTSNDCLIFNGGKSDPPDGLPIANMASTWPVIESANPGSCDGIELIRPLVGSDYNTHSGVIPGTAVPYQLPGNQIPNETGARFRAGFHNNTDQTLGDANGNGVIDGDEIGITAEFRIANWGMQWNTWQDATWNQVATGELVGRVTPNGYAGAFGQGVLQSDLWVPAESGLALENSHQCIHARLRATNGATKFAVDSVYRNMDIVNASVFRRPVDIDLTKRKVPKGKKNHDVFLLVRTENMPDASTCKKNKNRYGCAKGGAMVLERKALNGKQKKALSKELDAGRIDKVTFNELTKQKKRKGKKKPEELPYMVVYGMVDSGRRINLPNKQQVPVLVPFSSYGYAVQHEGLPSEGWESYMHGAQQVGKTDNLYKMEVKPNTVASVANTVRVLSKETKKCKTPPKSTWAVYSNKKTQDLEAKVKADVGKGKVATIAKTRVKDGQLGCDPPPLRLPCKRGKCAEHSPIDYIEGSRYVGDWSVVDRRAKKPAGKLGKKPTPRKPGARRPGARRPGARGGAIRRAK